MKNHKVLRFILTLILAASLIGCNPSGGNKTRPAPTRPKTQMKKPVKKSTKPGMKIITPSPGRRQSSK